MAECMLDYRHAAVWCPSCDALERQTYSTARMQGAIEALALEMRALREDIPTSVSAPPRPGPGMWPKPIQPPKRITEPSPERGKTYRWRS